MLSASLDLTQFHARVAQSSAALNRDMEQAVRRAAERGRDKAKQGSFKDVTGNLRRGISAEIVGWSGSTYRWSFRTNSTYALFVEEPTQAHWIYPKAPYNAKKTSLQPGQTRRGRGPGPHEYVVGRGQFLRWTVDGTSHFARRVFHPGTTGVWFMRSAEAWSPTFLRQSFTEQGFAQLRAVWN